MATGFPSAYKLEVEFTAGFWTDITADVDFERGIQRQFGRTREGELVAAGSLSFTLYNHHGAYTPDNPVGQYYPNVVEHKKIRLTVTKSIARVSFVGFVVSWAPHIPAGGGYPDGRCDVVAATFDGAFNRGLRSRRTEVSRLGGLDAWVLDEAAPGGRVFPNVRAGGASARVVRAKTAGRKGRAAVVGAEGLPVEGAWECKPANNGVASVLVCTLTDANPTHISFAFRVASEGATGFVFAGYRNNGRLEASMNVVGSGDLRGSSSPVDTIAANVDDGRWRYLSLSPSGSNYLVEVREEDGTIFTSGSFPGDVTRIKTLVFGGLPGSGPTNGDQTLCIPVQIAAIAAGTTAANANTLSPTIPKTTTDTVTSWATQLGQIAGIAPTIVGTENQTIQPGNITGKTYLENLQRTAQTIAGTAWVRPDGGTEIRQGDAVRTLTPVLTVDLPADGSGAFELSRDVESSITRVTVTYPDGVQTIISAAAEAGGVSNELSVETDSLDAEQALGLGSYLLTQGSGLRITRMGLNLASATTDLYAQVHALYPGATVQINNLPGTFLGYTQATGIVQGWEHTDSQAGVYVTLDLTPADSPRSSTLGSNDRVDSSNTFLGASVTAAATTITATTLLGSRWSTTAGDYPLVIRIDGEKILAPTAPASPTAPIWVGVTRGVDGTIAAPHVLGARINVGYPFQVTF